MPRMCVRVDNPVLRSDNGGILKATTKFRSGDRSRAPQVLCSETLTLCLPGAKQGIFRCAVSN